MRTGVRGAAGWLAVGLACCAAQAAHARDWLEARIDDFVLVTDGKESYARQTLRDFAVFKHALGALAPLTREVPRMPTQMYALEGGDWRSFAPSTSAAGFFSAHDESNYIIFDRTPTGLLSREVVFHEYMHFVLHAGSSVIVPAWWGEGVAELFSSLRERNGKLEFGVLPNGRRAVFKYFELMPTATLLAADRDSPQMRKHVSAPVFYAQAWLTVHYMLIENPQRGRQTETYLNLVSAGKPIEEAVQQAYGVSVDELDGEIRAYREKGRIGAYLMTFKTPLPDARDVVIRALPEAVALSRLSIAGMVLGWGAKDSEERALRALKLDPALPLAHAALALVRFSQDRRDEALQLSRKVLAGPADPQATGIAVSLQYRHIQYPTKPKDPAGDDETVEELIDDALSTDQVRHELSPEQVLTLQSARAAALPFTSDPDHGIGVTLTVAAIDYLLRDRTPEEALAPVQRAVSLYPTHPSLAETEAMLCAAAGHYTAALASASRAARYARSPNARRRLENWAQELEAAADPSR